MAKVNPLDRVREICLALPEAHEKVAWGAPTFRVKDKLFAMFALDHHGDGRVALWCKAPPGAQEMLIESDPESFFKPPYVGPSGWIGIRLDRKLAWNLVAGLVAEGYRLTAPKRLLALLDAPPGSTPKGPTPASPSPTARSGTRRRSRRP